ncbi:hypothetical protein KUTeg_023637 [Tegillarca granosa]|uniref:Uncharacterized protein n=1 Tax=Tegillarca granosa TaxID=220873 RepID=A0ABQ9E7P4_TEGGR|nr:hypothetical protein KUTeg_023637 [Tegillarca granosa]
MIILLLFDQERLSRMDPYIFWTTKYRKHLKRQEYIHIPADNNGQCHKDNGQHFKEHIKNINKLVSNYQYSNKALNNFAHLKIAKNEKIFCRDSRYHVSNYQYSNKALNNFAHLKIAKNEKIFCRDSRYHPAVDEVTLRQPAIDDVLFRH